MMDFNVAPYSVLCVVSRKFARNQCGLPHRMGDLADENAVTQVERQATRREYQATRGEYQATRREYQATHRPCP